MHKKQLSSRSNNSIIGMIDYQQVANIVRQERKSKGLTQAELAKKVGLSSKTIENIEKGSSVRDITLLKVMNYLDYQAVTYFSKIKTE